MSLIQQAINRYYGQEYAEEAPAEAEAPAAADDTALEGSATMSESVEAGAAAEVEGEETPSPEAKES